MFRCKAIFAIAIMLSVVILVPYGGLAAADQKPKVPPPPLTARELRALELPELISLAAYMDRQMREIYEGLKWDHTSKNLTPESILEFGHYHLQESFQFLLLVAQVQLQFFGNDNPGAREDLLMAALTGLENLASALPTDNVRDFADLVEEAKGQLKGRDLYGTVVARLKKIETAMAARSEPLFRLNERILEAQGSVAGRRNSLAQMQALMERRLIGQPEVVQALMDMEWRNALYGGERRTPDAIYLMGLPGTGKDTAAETFTDALHGMIGAHKAHMFRLPIMKHEGDKWQVLGSATGYIGSQATPPFLEFLVLHSGGRYMFKKAGDGYAIFENPDYKGQTLQGYFGPESGVVFVNEFHNWSRTLKDEFIKEALEKGIFKINNPKGGLKEISVPIRFVIASNEGIRLITSREANGQRLGPPLTYPQILEKWKRVHADKRILKGEILATNGAVNSPNSSTGNGPGVSEELLSRIPDRNIILMRPLSPDDLQKIVQAALTDLATRLNHGKGLLGNSTIAWEPELVRVIQEYDFVAEENARPVVERVTSLIEEPLIDAVKSQAFRPPAGKAAVKISIETNSDRTKSLVLRVEGHPEVRQPIRATLKDLPREPITDERIDFLDRLDQDLKENVFGIDGIIERLVQRILSLENEATGRGPRPANVMMLTGLSSTGKTETAKQLSRHLSGQDEELVTFDFSQIQTQHDFKARILGLRDSLGNPIPSDFMKHYDRANGRLVVVFDELANVRDADLLKSLYDFFREPVVSTFSDGKPRSMGGVTVIITGNAGQELYAQVPRDVPHEVQMAAWQQIFEQTNRDFELQRRILEKYYPEPLITRIGRNNIFFMPPHTYRSLRQLAQLKLKQSIKKMESREGRRGWQIRFGSEADYVEFIAATIDEGFSLRYQGASIDSFIRDDFEDPLKYLLLKNKVPTGAEVRLRFYRRTNPEGDQPGYVVFQVEVAGQKDPILFKIKRAHQETNVERNKISQIVTAFHEAGHAIARKALFKDAYESTMVSVIPGVTMIGDQWIYYAGVAKAMQKRELSTIREWVVRQIAILAAGETAERLVSRGETHSTGKRNDMERASALAIDAITRHGLSEKWGTQAVPAGMSTENYLNSLSDKKRSLLEAEKEALIKEGRELAMRTLEANFHSSFVPLGVLLAEKGELNFADLKQFFANHSVVDPSEISAPRRLAERARTRARKWFSPRTKGHEVELDSSITIPNQIADINAIVLERKLKQFGSVPVPADAPIVKDSVSECDALLVGRP